MPAATAPTNLAAVGHSHRSKGFAPRLPDQDTTQQAAAQGTRHIDADLGGGSTTPARRGPHFARGLNQG
jgi:hypothetical protein